MSLRTKLRRWWHGLWIRPDICHPSFDWDSNTMEDMSLSEQLAYRQEVLMRRAEAYRRECEHNNILP